MLARVSLHRYLLLAGLIALLLLAGLVVVLPVQAQEPDANPGGKLYLPAIAGGAAAGANGDVIPGQYIVVLKDAEARAAGNGGQAETEANAAARMASEYGGEVLYVYDAALSGFAIRIPDAAAALLAADASVDYIEPDRIAGIPEPVGANAGEDAASELSIAATDAVTQSGAVWGLDRIDQRLLPLNTQYYYTTTAAGVHAYIIDTGILVTHTQFTGRIGNGYTAIADGRGAVDCNGHGTHVAGTVGGTTYGVAKGVTLHPVRVLGCSGSGSNSGVIAGINWVTANKISPAVGNMSLGGGMSFALRTAVERAIAAGVVMVVAAGNDNANACLYSPASVPGAITVGSTTSIDERSSFSNWGSCVDIFAPGSVIKSAWYTSASATNIISGTSMATPHVAGVVALFLKGQPAATPAQATTWLLNAATPGLVLGAGNGSPNRLLYIGLPAPAPVACTNRILNPGFESGTANWARSSTNGLQTICSAATCGSDMPTPRSGSYIAWLGRNANSEISQIVSTPAITLPVGVSARLSFWYAIDSEDSCGWDYGYVRLVANGVTSTVKTFKLCYENTSNSWQRMQIDLSAYAGKTLSVVFRASSDSLLPSSLYVDNVQLVTGNNCTLLAAADDGVVEEPENGSAEDIVVPAR